MTKENTIKLFEDRQVRFNLGCGSGEVVYIHCRCGQCIDRKCGWEKILE